MIKGLLTRFLFFSSVIGIGLYLWNRLNAEE